MRTFALPFRSSPALSSTLLACCLAACLLAAAPAAAQPVVGFASGGANVTEGDIATDDNNVVVEVALSDPSMTEATTVRVRRSGGTAEAEDIIFSPQNITFEAGFSGLKTFTVGIEPDTQLEGDESVAFELTLVSGPAGASVDPDASSFVLVIIDDDFPEASPNAWINEFHYENAGADENEFAEVVVQLAPGVAANVIDRLALVLYDGASRTPYSTTPLAQFQEGQVLTQNNGNEVFQLFSYAFGPETIQNGPDGLALCYDLDEDGDFDADDTVVASRTLIQFISYEGSFEGRAGCTTGVQSRRIQPTEDDNTPSTSAIALIGGEPNGAPGDEFSDFTWSLVSEATPGEPNPLQRIPVELVAFAATPDGAGTVELDWRTASEEGNAGFYVEHRRSQAEMWTEAGFVQGAGTTTEARSYRFRTEGLTPGTYQFRLRQVDVDGTEHFSDAVETVVSMAKGVFLDAASPNPSAGRFSVTFGVSQASTARLALYDALGREVAVLHDGAVPAGEALTLQPGSTLPSGLYVMRLVTEHGSRTQTVTVVR